MLSLSFPTILLLVVCVFIFLANDGLCIPVPVTNAEEKTLYCRSSTAKDLVLFIFANYLSHAATVPVSSGTPWHTSLRWTIISLFNPFAGLAKAIQMGLSYMEFGKDDVGKALSQGALIVVIRDGGKNVWKPGPVEDPVYGTLSHNLESDEGTRKEDKSISSNAYPTIGFSVDPDAVLQYSTREVNFPLQGKVENLPTGYLLAPLPARYGAVLISKTLKDTSGIKLARSQSWVKMGSAVLQVIFASISIYNTRADQIERYGYTAYGLSVFPYLLMSVANLFITGIVGQYPSCFLLRTSILEEAERRGGVFDGTIGSVDEENVKALAERSDIDFRNTVVGYPNGLEFPDATFCNVKLSMTTLEGGESGREETATSKPTVSPTVTLKSGPYTRTYQLGSGEYSAGMGLIPCSPETLSTTQILRINQISNLDLRELLPSYYTNTGKFSILPFMKQYLLPYVIPILVCVLPYVFVYLLSNFRKGSRSIIWQRLFMMCWIAMNQLCYFVFKDIVSSRTVMYFVFSGTSLRGILVFVAIWFFFSWAAIGGFIAVGQMVLEDETCTLL